LSLGATWVKSWVKVLLQRKVASEPFVADLPLCCLAPRAVEGFAGRSNGRLSGFLCGCRRPQVPSGDARSRSDGSLGGASPPWAWSTVLIGFPELRIPLKPAQSVRPAAFPSSASPRSATPVSRSQ
jgi:hypothetical protein